MNPAALDAIIDTYEHQVKQRNGARLGVGNLNQDGSSGPTPRPRWPSWATGGDTLTAVEERTRRRCTTSSFCTLCSCYPWAILGLPPVCGINRQPELEVGHRKNARGVLRDFGLEVGDEVEVRVWDSTAEQRCLVLPERPAGTEHLSEAQLAALVTQDAMVGVAKVHGDTSGRSRAWKTGQSVTWAACRTWGLWRGRDGVFMRPGSRGFLRSSTRWT